jgi:D-alanyl-D-alanine carboxypeptidase
LRDPPDKAEITGCANEPWHLRYVGVELAAELPRLRGWMMEEHFGLAPRVAASRMPAG